MCIRDSSKIHGAISLDKTGIPIYDIARDGRLIPNHHLANILWKYATHHLLSLTEEQSQAYAEYKDVKLTDTQEALENGFYILKFQDYGYSLTKKVSETLKNKII